MSLTMARRGAAGAAAGATPQNKGQQQFLETVWSEPGSPVGEQPELNPTTACPDKDLNLNDTVGNNNKHKRTNSTSYYDEALEALLRGFQGEVDGCCGTPGDPDQLFLLPDRVLTVDSLTFREELAAVAPSFLSPVTPTAPQPPPSGVGFGKLNNNNNNNPPHSSLDSTDSNRSVRLADDTEGLIFTRACNGCLWLCEFTIR